MRKTRKVVKVAVIGLGNTLLGDDGVGPRVVQELKTRPGSLPPEVEVLEGSGSYYNYWDAIHEASNLIVVDAVMGGGSPGSVYLLSPEQVTTGSNGAIDHEDDFFGILQLATWRGHRPRVVLVGVEPKEVEFSLELSAEVEGRIQEVIDLVRRQCNAFLKGGPVTEKITRC